ncbi:glyoxalase/bleomycin resistance/extradiol dioxygenase family protein [Amaricoccus sp.]|uniref:VOC family protein n=1 Tax=Amaricoccus sp. TaxID=1872485 RepID=UPI001B59390B|nr:glyoxalase/bleomycin resistance/extradiol dioxygenase family protein [Amaricoccus sp.]MBP7002118.1 glyoxalase/bleomycin resistance/extradiol dioxygenase family protein [Amaricoccus sp.]
MPDDEIQTADPRTTTRPSAEVMSGVIPYLDMNGRAAEAAGFYARAFGARDLGSMADPQNPGRHMHVQIEINGGALMMSDGMSADQRPAPSGLHLQLVVDDGHAWWKRAVEAGCDIVMPYEKQFWGDWWGLLKDPFGVLWGVLEAGPEQRSL